MNFVKNAITKQKTQYEIYNCGSGVPIKVKDLVKKIVYISGKKIKINYNKAKPSIPFNMYLNISKAKKELGWSPKNNIDLGIKKQLTGGMRILSES